MDWKKQMGISHAVRQKGASMKSNEADSEPRHEPALKIPKGAVGAGRC